MEEQLFKDLVMNTHEVDALLGVEGKTGLVEPIINDERRMRRIREIVAAAYEDRAEMTNAVKLYHLVSVVQSIFNISS